MESEDGEDEDEDEREWERELELELELELEREWERERGEVGGEGDSTRAAISRMSKRDCDVPRDIVSAVSSTSSTGGLVRGGRVGGWSGEVGSGVE